jgi:predicted metal-dependent hydrolase
MTGDAGDGPEQFPPRYLDGIRLFNEGHFFEAHEAWEDVWRETTGPARAFYQGLIQCAVAMEHLRRSNPRGAMKLFKNYPGKFEGLPRPFMGIDIDALLRDMQRALAPVIEASGELELRGDPAALPKISLDRAS